MNETTQRHYEAGLLEQEERAMEAEEVRQAMLDQQKADYVKYLLAGFVSIPIRFMDNAAGHQYTTAFQYEVWQDWFDSLDNNVIELVRLNLAAGDREKAGLALIESLEEYMDEIASQAVDEKNKRI